MSDQNFHEIQLSGKQLVFLFICVVVLTVVVFLFGVSVGRGVRSATAQNAQVVSVPSPAEMNRPAEAPAPTQAPANELSYAEALQAGGEDPSKAAPPSPVEEPAAAAPQKSMAAAPPPATATQTPPPAAKDAPKADAGSGEWVVQVGAFNARDVAAKEATKLEGRGYPAFVFTEAPATPGPRYKVRVGPYVARSDADRILRDLTREGYKPLLKR